MRLIIDTKKIILVAIIPLLTIGLTINYANAIENPFESFIQSSEKQIISDTPMTPRAQMLAGLSANQVMCKDGLNLVIKFADGTPACVKASTVFKLIERSWISVESAFAEEPEPEIEQIKSEPKTITTQLDFLPSKKDRAMYFQARFSEGLIQYEVIKTTFFKFTPFKGDLVQNTPENPLPLKPTFRLLLETLPNKENIGYYQAIEKYFSTESTLFRPFDISIDVVSGDGTILQTWEYRNCDLEDYSVYLQDNVIFRTFTGENESEIRERSIFNCRGLFLVAPEN